MEFGDERVARLDAGFIGGPSPRAPLQPPSLALAEEKKEFATGRWGH